MSTETTTRRTTADYVQREGITLLVLEGPAEQVDTERDGQAGKGWTHDAFRVRLVHPGGATLETPWKQGTAHRVFADLQSPRDRWLREAARLSPGYDAEVRRVRRAGGGHVAKVPDAGEVLDALVSDAMTVLDGGTFEAWADELGYDPDSRRAYAMWDACRDTLTDLARFVGLAGLASLVHEYDRL